MDVELACGATHVLLLIWCNLVIFRGTYWIRFRAMLQKEEDRPQINWGCRVLEVAIMEIFARNG
ncbi:hypothetical protein ACP70R_048044 [Stipagrostis hirtigluma subsp. patula]